MVSPVEKYKGDDWSFPFQWRDANGVGIDLTGYTVGAELYKAFVDTPTDLTVENGDVAVTDVATGKFRVDVDRTVTVSLSADAAAAKSFPNRLQVFVIDTLGNRQTLGVLPIKVTAP